MKAVSGDKSLSVRCLGPLVAAARGVCRVLLSTVVLASCQHSSPEKASGVGQTPSRGSTRSAVPLEAPPGKWRRARGVAPEEAAQRQAANLKAIPYLQGYREAEDRRVISHFDRSRALSGWNFYVSGHAAEATLMDMEGNVLQRWKMPLRRLWPESQIAGLSCLTKP